MATGFSAGFSIITSGAIEYQDCLSAAETSNWPAAEPPPVKFLFAQTIGRIKKKMGSTLYEGSDPDARRGILSYIEAVTDKGATILVSTWGGSATAPDYASSTGTKVANPSLANEIAALGLKNRAGAAVTNTQELADWCKEMANKAVKSFMNAQFTFLFAIAKKGDMTRDFTRKTVRAIQKELDILDLDIYTTEVPWLADFLIRRLGYTDNDEWDKLFKMIKNNSPNVERTRTVAAWAAGAGITKLQMVCEAYTQFEDFDWTTVSKILPGQLEAAARMYQTYAKTPYRAFYAPDNHTLEWPCTEFLQLAKLCHMMLTMDGNTSLNGYRGLENVNLKNLTRWTSAVRTYLEDRGNKAFADLGKQSGHIQGISFSGVPAV